MFPAGEKGHRHIALNITRRCNQRCIFCFEGERVGWTEPSLGEVKALLEESAKTHDFVVFMGGEALLRKDILEILRFGRSIGLTMDVFTNGQVLARNGFVEQLAEAGLDKIEISFHYADARSFAEGTRTPAGRFDRLLLGLNRLRDHNRRSPEKAIKWISIETEIFRLNYDRLDEIAALLEEALGECFIHHRLGYLDGAPQYSGNHLLVPFEHLRARLVCFLEKQASKREINLAKIPLCLAPGFEHLALEPAYKFENTDVRANFADKKRLGAMHQHLESYLNAPYRFVCSCCNLLPLCSVKGSSWHSRSTAPTRSTKPFPEKRRTAAEVLAMKYENGATPPQDAVDAHCAMWRSIPIPEKEIIDSWSGFPSGELRLESVYCQGRPLFEMDLVSRGVPVSLGLRLFEPDQRPGESEAYLLHYAYLENGNPSVQPAERIERVVERLAGISFPPLEAWNGYRYFDRELSSLAQDVWNHFGQDVWPGRSFASGWTTKKLIPRKDTFCWKLRHENGVEADLVLCKEGAEVSREASSPPEVWMRSDTLALHGPRRLGGLGRTESCKMLDALHREMGRIVGRRSDGRIYPRDESLGELLGSRAGRVEELLGQYTRYADRPGTVRLTFSDREGELEDLTLLLAPRRPGDSFLLEVGDRGLCRFPDPSPRALSPRHKGFLACVKVVVAAVKRGNKTDPRELGEAIVRLATKTRLGRRFRCVVSG